MQTLEEFLRDKTLPVKVRGKRWHPNVWFEVHYLLDGAFYGHEDRFMPNKEDALDVKEWELYKEPSKLVPWYQWRWRRKNYDKIIWHTTGYYCKTDKDFLEIFGDDDSLEYFRDDESKRMWPE